MLTKLTVRNFKRLREAEIELGNPVIFIGPNNSGKTTALQALYLWQVGVRQWLERRQGAETPEKRPGITINRRDLVTVPVPSANLLWRNRHVNESTRYNGKQDTKKIFIDIIVEGISDGAQWKCGFEFYYANEESFYCRPLRAEDKDGERLKVPEEAGKVKIAYLPPMSGMTSNEIRLDPGAIQVRLGEGRTAEVLRNLCHQVLQGPDGASRWQNIVELIRTQFGASLEQPRYIAERGEIALEYTEPSETRLDITCAGRGLQQMLLLLAHVAGNSTGSVLLLDEPDAHLEILRQREVYNVLSETARTSGVQVIAASHSEVLLNEAADRDVVVAFVGKPHRIDDRGSQVVKSLKEIGFDQYYQAEQTGWVLYLEGSTDLAILRSLARKTRHRRLRTLKDRSYPTCSTSRARPSIISSVYAKQSPISSVSRSTTRLSKTSGKPGCFGR